MGKDGDYSVGAKVYESKKKKNRRLVMNNDSESEEFVITPRVEIFQAGNGAASGKRSIVLEKSGGRQKSLMRGDVLERKLGSEGSRGKILEARTDRRSREIVVDQPDGEDIKLDSGDSSVNQTDTTGGIEKSLVPEKVLESKFYRKRNIVRGDDEFSGKRTKTEHIDSVDNQTEKSGEGNNIVGGDKDIVQVSNLSVPRVNHMDEDCSSERNFQQSPGTSSKAEAVRWLGRSGQRELRSVKDASSSDFGIKKEMGNGTSSHHSYIRTLGKSGVLRVLKSNKKIDGSENADVEYEGQGNSMRLRSRSSNRFSASNHQLEREVDKKSISIVKPQKGAGKVSSEDTGKSTISKVNQENISQKKGSKNADLWHSNKSDLSAKKKKKYQ